MKPCESAEQIGCRTYAPTLKKTEGPIPLDANSKRIGIRNAVTTENVDILELPPCRLRELYSSKACLKKPRQETQRKTRKCLLVREGEYAQLGQKLYDTEIVEVVQEEPKKIIGLFGVPKDGGEKK